MPKVQDLSSFRVPSGFRGRSAIVVQLWWIVQATLFRLSPQVLYGFRSFLLRLFGARIGKGVLIRPSARITYPWHLEIGDHCWVGDDSVLYNLGKITIGNDVAIAHRVYLCTGLHDYEDPQFSIAASPITIEDEVWLPNDIFVGPGVTIGRGCVVGARSTVLRDLPEMMLCAGYPAKPIRPRLTPRDDIREARHREQVCALQD
ncbi:MAG: putative colanic acid biosynthesis acetyltransferase [Terriglobales bacterium]